MTTEGFDSDPPVCSRTFVSTIISKFSTRIRVALGFAFPHRALQTTGCASTALLLCKLSGNPDFWIPLSDRNKLCGFYRFESTKTELELELFHKYRTLGICQEFLKTVRQFNEESLSKLIRESVEINPFVAVCTLVPASDIVTGVTKPTWDHIFLLIYDIDSQTYIAQSYSNKYRLTIRKVDYKSTVNLLQEIVLNTSDVCKFKTCYLELFGVELGDVVPQTFATCLKVELRSLTATQFTSACSELEQLLTTTCFACRQPADSHCPCRQVSYCSKECQRKDWNFHKASEHNFG